MTGSSDSSLGSDVSKEEPPVSIVVRSYFGAGGAQWFGWAALAVVNQLLLLGRGLPARTSVRLLHHAYDAGQLLAAGAASFALVEISERFAARLGAQPQARWPRALVTGLAGFTVGLLILRSDLANAAARYRVPAWVAVVLASFGIGVLLGTIAGWARAGGWLTRGVLILGGVAGAVANAFILLGDYPAVHLMLAWFSALLIAAALHGFLPRPRVARLPQRVLVAVLALASLAALLRPPPQAVLARLYSLPSSVLAPFAAHFYPEHSGPALELVRREFLQSPWFQARTSLPPVPASGALSLGQPQLVLFLTIDALRADVVQKPEHLAKLRGFTALHQGCAHFVNARSTASGTRASLASVFTGHYYSQLRCDILRLDYNGPRLPVLVSEAGVRTISLPRLNRISIASGATVGFQTEIKGAFPARVLADKIIQALDEKGRTFLYAHFGEPHAPYKGRGSPFQRYLQEVARVDAALLRLFEFLKESGLDKHTLLIVSADHGEAFGEHGVNYHGRIIYEEVARVPLFLCGPGIAGREIVEPVSLIDIAPTVLDAFSLPAPAPFMGQSLLPLAAGGKERLTRPIAIHASHGLAGFYLRDGLKVLFNDPGKTVEVYDLVKDPGETVNLSDSAEPAVRSAIETARLFFHQHRITLAREYPAGQSSAPAEGAPVDEVLAEGEE